MSSPAMTATWAGDRRAATEGGYCRARHQAGSRRVRALILALVVVGQVTLPADALAQGESPGTHRKWLAGAIAAVVVGVPTFASADFGLRLGSCESRECFAPIATVAAFTVGFLLGKELDDAAARRFVAGPGTDLVATRTLELPFVPRAARAFGTRALFLGPEGMVVLKGQTARTVGGVRGLVDVTVLEGRQAILAATPDDLFAFPLAGGDCPGRRVSTTGGRRIASDRDGAVVLSGVGGLRRYAARGADGDVELVEDGQAPGLGPAAELLWPESSETLWFLDGARLVSLSAGTLAEVGAVELPAAPTSLDVRGPVGLAAAGRSGVYVLDVSDPRLPRVVATYRGVRDPRHAVLLGARGYVAAGDQGLVVLDLSTPVDPVVSAVVRNLGRPSLVLRRGDHVLVIDQETGEVHQVSR